MIRRLAHLCFITNDLDRIVAFCRDKLGLVVKFRFAAADQSVFSACLAVGDTTFIEFFDRRLSARQWGGDHAPLPPGNRCGHFCIEFTGLPGFRELLFARGVEIGEIRTGLEGPVRSSRRSPLIRPR